MSAPVSILKVTGFPHTGRLITQSDSESLFSILPRKYASQSSCSMSCTCKALTALLWQAATKCLSLLHLRNYLLYAGHSCGLCHLLQREHCLPSVYPLDVPSCLFLYQDVCRSSVPLLQVATSMDVASAEF